MFIPLFLFSLAGRRNGPAPSHRRSGLLTESFFLFFASETRRAARSLFCFRTRCDLLNFLIMETGLTTHAWTSILQGLSVLLIIVSGLLGVRFLVRQHSCLRQTAFTHIACIRKRPLEPFQAITILGVILFFSLPVALAPATAVAHPPRSLASLTLNCIAYAVFGLSTCAIALTLRKTSFRSAFLARAAPWRIAYKKGVFYGIATIAPILLLSYVCTEALAWVGVDTSSQDVFAWLDDPALPPAGAFVISVTAILAAPITEEVMFRGILLPCALKPQRAFWPAALLIGVLFATVHFHPASFLPLIVLSLLFSAGYAQTGSILTPITMHALFNATSLLFFYAGFK